MAKRQVKPKIATKVQEQPPEMEGQEVIPGTPGPSPLERALQAARNATHQRLVAQQAEARAVRLMRAEGLSWEACAATLVGMRGETLRRRYGALQPGVGLSSTLAAMGKQKRYARHRDRGRGERGRVERPDPGVPDVLGGLVGRSTDVSWVRVERPRHAPQPPRRRARSVQPAPPPVPTRPAPVAVDPSVLPSALLARWRARWGSSGPGPGQATDAPAAPVQVVGDDH